MRRVKRPKAEYLIRLIDGPMKGLEYEMPRLGRLALVPQGAVTHTYKYVSTRQDGKITVVDAAYDSTHGKVDGKTVTLNHNGSTP